MHSEYGFRMTANWQKFGESFFLKNHTQNLVERIFLYPFIKIKIKIEHISGSIAKSFI